MVAAFFAFIVFYGENYRNSFFFPCPSYYFAPFRIITIISSFPQSPASPVSFASPPRLFLFPSLPPFPLQSPNSSSFPSFSPLPPSPPHSFRRRVSTSYSVFANETNFGRKYEISQIRGNRDDNAACRRKDKSDSLSYYKLSI